MFRGGDANLYAYVGNDPVNRIDPKGLTGAALGAELGAEVGTLIAPGAGTVIGALVGAGAGIWLGAQLAEMWAGSKIPSWLADALGIPRKELGKRLHKIKEAGGLRGDDNVKINPTSGDVCDIETDEPLGNLHDEDEY